ncbi:interferon-inducible GTPase 5-like [Notolabrus celidotus]|uniref:interferon-inducible GTPase 5-like n=1 Tax=Notolabrus celidotus TaxID=1203425 RepID=UPI00148FC5E9|nr:interferon-inducible GTPase 5-like [Notolabrus celidotus]
MEENFPLNVAVTGEYGSGKSTFVNAIRGVDNMDERAAPTGSVGITEDVTPYSHPNYPHVTFWDLPGVGTTNYPAAEYVKLVELERFDFFVIISADRLRESDVKLAKEIQKMGKRFYYVRSKIDNNVRDKEGKQRGFDAERTLTQIRENCIQGLQEQGLRSPQVFLVSSIDPNLFDFPLLAEILKRKLPELKRDAFLLAMPNTSLEMIDRKKEAFKSKIKYVAGLSAAVAAAPVHGLSIAFDLVLLVGVFTRYVFGFGLNTSSLRRVSRYTCVPYVELRSAITPSLTVKKVTPVLVLKTLFQTVSIVKLMTGYRFIPMLGIPLSMAFSCFTTYKALNILLNVLADDARRVFRKALD